jgi:hypothetical protein
MIDASKGFMKDGRKIASANGTSIRSWTPSGGRTKAIHATPEWCRWRRSRTQRTTTISTSRATSTAPSRRIYKILTGHLRGGISERDINVLGSYWMTMPGLRAALFEKFDRPGYCKLRLPVAEMKPAIFGHTEFTAFPSFGYGIASRLTLLRFGGLILVIGGAITNRFSSEPTFSCGECFPFQLSCDPEQFPFADFPASRTKMRPPSQLWFLNRGKFGARQVVAHKGRAA